MAQFSENCCRVIYSIKRDVLRALIGINIVAMRIMRIGLCNNRIVREHGTRSMYVGGCRCPECRLAESNFQKGRRRRGIKPGMPLASAPHPEIAVAARAPVAPIPAGPGRVEAAVDAEIAMLSTASKRPGLVAGALAMARILDNPLATPQHAPAMRRMQDALAELRIGADVHRGWLGDVRELSGTAG